MLTIGFGGFSGSPDGSSETCVQTIKLRADNTLTPSDQHQMQVWPGPGFRLKSNSKCKLRMQTKKVAQVIKHPWYSISLDRNMWQGNVSWWIHSVGQLVKWNSWNVFASGLVWLSNWFWKILFVLLLEVCQSHRPLLGPVLSKYPKL